MIELTVEQIVAKVARQQQIKKLKIQASKENNQRVSEDKMHSNLNKSYKNNKIDLDGSKDIFSKKIGIVNLISFNKANDTNESIDKSHNSLGYKYKQLKQNYSNLQKQYQNQLKQSSNYKQLKIQLHQILRKNQKLQDKLRKVRGQTSFLLNQQSVQSNTAKKKLYLTSINSSYSGTKINKTKLTQNSKEKISAKKVKRRESENSGIPCQLQVEIPFNFKEKHQNFELQNQQLRNLKKQLAKKQKQNEDFRIKQNILISLEHYQNILLEKQKSVNKLQLIAKQQEQILKYYEYSTLKSEFEQKKNHSKIQDFNNQVQHKIKQKKIQGTIVKMGRKNKKIKQSEQQYNNLATNFRFYDEFTSQSPKKTMKKQSGRIISKDQIRDVQNYLLSRRQTSEFLTQD